MRVRSAAREGPLRVLFACTANIARSPYAERRAADLIGTSEGRPAVVTFASAGVPGVAGRGMDPEMAAQLRARRIDPAGHVSRSINREILESSHVVLTFEFVHRLRILDTWPDHAMKVFGLHQLEEVVARLPSRGSGLALLDEAYVEARPDGLSNDVPDPHGRGAALARACAREIDAALEVIVPALAGRRT